MGSRMVLLTLIVFLITMATLHLLISIFISQGHQLGALKPILLYINLDKKNIGSVIIDSFVSTDIRAGDTYNLYSPDVRHNPIGLHTEYGFYNLILNTMQPDDFDFIVIDKQFFGGNNFEMILKLDMFDIFTMIINPLQRMLANYYYDINNKYVDILYLQQIETLDDRLKWYNSLKVNNYYVRFLNGFLDTNRVKINKKHFQRAKYILSEFDVVCVFEKHYTWKSIENRYNIQLRDLNEYYSEFDEINTETPTKEFIQWFMNENQWDFKLYNYAIDIANVINDIHP